MSAELKERRADPIGRVVAFNLHILRRHRGWTQADLAERLAPYIGGELTASAISQWEEGRNPNRPVRRYAITELWALCRIFQIPLSALLLPGVFMVSEYEVPTIHLFGEDFSRVWKDCFAASGDWEGMWLALARIEEQHRLIWADRTREGDRPEDDPLSDLSDLEIEELRQVLEASPKFQEVPRPEEGDGER